jgi:hypothetical protein
MKAEELRILQAGLVDQEILCLISVGGFIKAKN